MSRKKWAIWFVLSILWIYVLLFIAYFDGKMVNTFLYDCVFTIAALNVMACTYVGTEIAEQND